MKITKEWLQERATKQDTAELGFAPLFGGMPIHGWPQQPGYYWAWWVKAANGTDEGEELTPASSWELVQVNENLTGYDEYTDIQQPERLSVSVPGVEKAQWRDGFVWGPMVAALGRPTPMVEGE